MLITIQDSTCWCSRANASGARDPLLGGQREQRKGQQRGGYLHKTT